MHELQETDIRSPGSMQTSIRVDALDPRPWLIGAPVCKLLQLHQILHAGWARMVYPFEIVRVKLGGSYFLASLEGYGEVLVHGRWQTCDSGSAFLLPPGTLHAFRARPKNDWRFCWVRYADQYGTMPVAKITSPVLAPWDGEPLLHALQGLHRECTVRESPNLITGWVNLIHDYVQSFAQPKQVDNRLWELWEKVAETLDQDWNSARMAMTAGISEKQLERLCRRDMGRTPRQQLIWLRMRRAAELITKTKLKIDAIATQVGYANPFVFSSTFKRYMGYPPSQYGKG